MVIKLKKIYALLAALLVLAVSGCRLAARSVPAAAAVRTPLPIVMYHQVSQNKSRAGAYCVTLNELENDFRYIKACGCTAITTRQLLDAVDGTAPLPEKPIIITFDDGFESVAQYVEPLLKQYGLCAVVSVVGAYTDLYSQSDDHSVNYAYLTWEELARMSRGNTIEIQNHSYDLHHLNHCGRKGAKKCSGESEEAYRRFLQTDLQKMQTLCLQNGVTMPTAFTYPYGCYSKESKEIIKAMGFRAAYICEERMNYVDYDNTDWLFRLCRYNRPHGVETALFFSKLLDG